MLVINRKIDYNWRLCSSFAPLLPKKIWEILAIFNVGMQVEMNCLSEIFFGTQENIYIFAFVFFSFFLFWFFIYRCFTQIW